jgi:GDPmannose 4,6-dehydratase
MWQILQQNQPDDYVLATGTSKSVREFVELAFREIDVKLRWEGAGVDEIGVCTSTGKTIVRVDPRYFRPTEVDSLQGDASKAFRDFGWQATTSLADMVAEMVQHDLAELRSASQKS